MTGRQAGIFLGVFLVVATVVGFLIVLATRTPVVPVVPVATSTPMPTPAPCDLSQYNYLGIPLPAMAPNTTQTLNFDGGSVTLVCGSNGGQVTGTISQNPAPAPAKLSCTLGNGMVVADGKPFEEGGIKYTCVNGEKQVTATGPQPTVAPAAANRCQLSTLDSSQPSTAYNYPNDPPYLFNGKFYQCLNDGTFRFVGTQAAPAVPTVAAAPTAALPPAGHCALPSPDGYGHHGGWQPPGTKPNTQSIYTCDANGSGYWIEP